MKLIKCAFTGHRPQKLSFGFNESDQRCKDLQATLFLKILHLMLDQEVNYFISGMALGVDMYAAEIVMLMKKFRTSLRLGAAIPCEGQSKRWPAPQRMRYDYIRMNCDVETVLQERYTPSCMFQRNCYMVDNADIILAVWNGDLGMDSGTWQTVSYALELGKPIIVIDPVTLKSIKL